MKFLYSFLCMLGTVLPLSQFVPWLYQHGVNIPLLVDQAFGNYKSAFAWLDVLVSALVVLSLIIWEGKKIGMQKLWIPVIGLITIGVSLGLPLFLLLREIHLTSVRSSV